MGSPWVETAGAPLAIACCTTAETTPIEARAMKSQAVTVTNKDRAPTLKVCGIVFSQGDDI
jgi:hypothetical protein